MHIGFCGLGIMGWPMAGHLAAAGHEVAAWTHTPGKAAAWAADHPGGRAAGTPRDAADGAALVVVIVGDGAMSAEVIEDPDGVLAGLPTGAVVLDASTVLPGDARMRAAAAARAGARFLDGPVSGSKAGAEAGTLTFMVGGDIATLDEIRPALEPMAGAVYHCGPVGAGLAAKLAQNTFVTNLCAAHAEAMTLATTAGVDPGQMSEIIEHSGAQNRYASMKAAPYRSRDFSPAFSLKWAAKDAALITEAAATLGVPTPLTARCAELLAEGVAAGFGEDDLVGYVRVIEAAVAAASTTTAPDSASDDSRSA